MRILIATGIFPPDIGGPATYVPLFADQCLRRGHTVRVVAYGNPFLKIFSLYSVFRIPRLFLPIRYALFFFVCIFRGFRSDVIFAQDAFSSGIPAVFAAWVLRKRLVVKIVGDFSWEYARNSGVTAVPIDDFQVLSSYPPVIYMIRFFQRLVCRHASRVIVPSAYLKGIVIGWGIDSSKIVVVYNAVAIPPISTGPERDPFLIFSAGRLVPWKGFKELIRVFARVRAVFPLARLVIAGDGPCRAELVSCAQDAGVLDIVSFSGVISPDAMALQHSRAGCFVLFSLYEGLSHVILEALAHGTPVIASDAGGNGELIRNGVNGLLIPFGDETSLYHAIISFLSDPHKTIPHPGFIESSIFTWDALLSQTCRILGERS